MHDARTVPKPPPWFLWIAIPAALANAILLTDLLTASSNAFGRRHFTYAFNLVLFALFSVAYGTSKLEFSDQEFRYRFLMQSNQFAWSDVSEFSTRVIRFLTLPVGRYVAFDRASQLETRQGKHNRKRAGATDWLPSNFGENPESLAALMNERRAEALAKS